MSAERYRVIYVSANDLSRQSADIVDIMEMCNAFEKNGIRTTLCVPAFGTSRVELFSSYRVEHPFEIMEVALPRPFRRSSGLSGRSAVFSLQAVGRLLGTKGDIVYTREPWVFYLLSAVCGKRCYFEAHQFDFLGTVQTSLYRSMVKRGVESGKGRIVCISGTLRNKWQEYGVAASRMIVAHDAVNTARYQVTLAKDAARRQLGCESDRPVVAYTGSLIPGKGVDVLVRCANRLPDVTFMVVGGDAAQIEAHRMHAQHDNIRFVGQVPYSDIALYQAAADILALPNARGSLIDEVTSPMKLFEYIAAERPIVATDMPSLLEVLEGGYNALISPAGDDRGLAENIRQLVADPSLGCRIAANARNDLEKYSWDTRVQVIASLFRQAQ